MLWNRDCRWLLLGVDASITEHGIVLCNLIAMRESGRFIEGFCLHYVERLLSTRRYSNPETRYWQVDVHCSWACIAVSRLECEWKGILQLTSQQKWCLEPKTDSTVFKCIDREYPLEIDNLDLPFPCCVPCFRPLHFPGVTASFAGFPRLSKFRKCLATSDRREAVKLQL